MTDQPIIGGRLGERRPDIACPACGVSPYVGIFWACRPDGCGAYFDTFASRGRCPRCGAQYRWTVCPTCHKASAHRAWYRTAPTKG